MEGESVNVASVFRKDILPNALTKKEVYFFLSRLKFSFFLILMHSIERFIFRIIQIHIYTDTTQHNVLYSL